MEMITTTIQDFKNGQKYLCKDFYISCNAEGIYGNQYYLEVNREYNDSYVTSGYEKSRSSALKAARDKRKVTVDLYNGKVVNDRRYVFSVL